MTFEQKLKRNTYLDNALYAVHTVQHLMDEVNDELNSAKEDPSISIEDAEVIDNKVREILKLTEELWDDKRLLLTYIARSIEQLKAMESNIEIIEKNIHSYRGRLADTILGEDDKEDIMSMKKSIDIAFEEMKKTVNTSFNNTKRQLLDDNE